MFRRTIKAAGTAFASLMKHDTLITIVVPVYNRAGTVARCLDSMAVQEGIEHCRIIIVDNNSDDGSSETVIRWRDGHPAVDLMLISESRQGAAAARNAGLAQVTTPYVMFFDSDDEMLPGHMARLVSAVGQNPDADVFGWDIVCELPDGRGYKALFRCRRPMRDHLVFSSMSTQRFAARTAFVRAAGAWDSSLKGWDDFELGVRMIAANPVIVRLPDAGGRPLVRTYYSDDSITGATFSVSPCKWETALRRIGGTVSRVCPEHLPAVAFRSAALAGLYAREGASTDARRLLSESVCEGFGRIKARAVYETARLFGRGTRVLAWLMLR